VAVNAANFDPYCITAPVDPRLSGGGGNQICGLYDVNPAKFGQVNSLVLNSNQFGNQWEHFNGVDLTLTARLQHGILVQGGLSTGRTETNNCDVVLGNPQLSNPDPVTASITLPRTAAFCDIKGPWLTQVKGLATASLPLAFQASGTFQSLPGPAINATYVASNAQILPSLGRNLSAGANGTVVVDLVSPGTVLEARLYQLDGRLSKLFKVGQARLQANFDLYNLFNVSPILLLNTRYGPAWQTPQAILPGRLFKMSAQLNF
jgi:hypothetical protein